MRKLLIAFVGGVLCLVILYLIVICIAIASGKKTPVHQSAAVSQNRIGNNDSVQNQAVDKHMYVASRENAMSGNAIDNTGIEDMGIEDMGIEDMGIEDMGIEDMGIEDMAIEDMGIDDGFIGATIAKKVSLPKEGASTI